jgi:hypothetical protein
MSKPELASLTGANVVPLIAELILIPHRLTLAVAVFRREDIQRAAGQLRHIADQFKPVFLRGLAAFERFGARGGGSEGFCPTAAL